jgi:hypothetical protein
VAAFGQYYVPLRYDLRRGTPVYVPGREPWTSYGYYDAPNYDPYSFGAVQARNYLITGNVRAGKSFRGSTPYSDVGSELATTLPSLRLSNFRRDSIGVQDIGTGVEYGVPLPYFPSSAEVTTPYTAATRFQTPYPAAGPGPTPYMPAPYVPSWQVGPSPGYVPSATYIVPGLDTYTLDRVRVPESTWEALRRLAAEEETPIPPGTVSALPGPGAAPATESAVEQLIEKPTFRFEQTPSNILPPEPAGGVGPNGLPAPADLSLYLKPETVTPVLPAVPARAPGAADETAPKWASLTGPGGAAVPPPVPTPPAGASYEALLRTAETSMRFGNYENAAELFRQAAGLDASRPEAAFGQVHAFLGRRAFYQAALALARLIEDHPDWVKRPPDLKAAFENPKTYDDVLKDLRGRIQMSETARELNFIMGYALYAGGRTEEARPYLERAAAALKHLRTPEKILLEAASGEPK